jgi:lipoate---protein ligase
MKILDLTLPSPAENLACDEALLDAAESGTLGQSLRFWESPEYFVVVGYANKVATEVNLPACEAARIPVLRRCSGGGTVLQGPGCLNYNLVLKIANDSPLSTITGANRFIMERNRAALRPEIRNLKSEIRIAGHTDLALGDRKFSGNAQRRRRNFLLFHGTLLLDFDLARISQILRMPTLQPDYRNARSHGEFITNLGIESGTVKTALADAWSATSPGTMPSAADISRLVNERYARDEWNYKF